MPDRFDEMSASSRAPRPTSEGVPPNPYRNLRVELARYSYWSYVHEPQPYSRWWKSKYVSFIRRELVARGHEHDAWMDGTEEDLA